MEKSNPADAPNGSTPSVPPSIPEAPPFQPDVSLIGDMERGERPNGELPSPQS